MGSNTAGNYIDESLPNIKGSIGRTGDDSLNQTNGAFEQTSTASAVLNAATPGSFYAYVTNFNASRSSSAYQNGAKVRPDSLTCCYIIKY